MKRPRAARSQTGKEAASSQAAERRDRGLAGTPRREVLPVLPDGRVGRRGSATGGCRGAWVWGGAQGTAEMELQGVTLSKKFECTEYNLQNGRLRVGVP